MSSYQLGAAVNASNLEDFRFDFTLLLRKNLVPFLSCLINLQLLH